MEFLVELLALNEDRELEMLLEDLGNLKRLGLGRMANAFKQSFHYYDAGRRGSGYNGPRASDIGNKIKARETAIGPNSEIVDVKGQIKNWGSIKKAYRTAESEGKHPAAAVIYVQSKACVLIVGDIDKMASSKNVFGVAYDFTGLLDEDEVSSIVRSLDAFRTTSNYASDVKSSSKSSAKTANVRKYYGDETKISNYEATGVSHKNMGSLFDGLAEAFGVKLHAKIIMKDDSMAQKASERAKNRPIKPSDIKLFKDDLNTRLVKFKLNNADSAETVKEFIDKIFSGTGKKIKFAGETYESKPGTERWGNTTESGALESLMNGKSVKIFYYGAKKPGSYGSSDNYIQVEVKLIKNVLTPVSVSWKEIGENGERSNWKTENLL